MKVIFYSTHCPQCMILEKKLKSKKIEYEEVNDVNLMIKKGFLTSPLLEVDGKVMTFKEAFTFVDSL